MIKNPYPGKFIVFEGLDGSGQTTQSSLLRNFLVSRGKEVVSVKEPTQDSEAGKKIRQVLRGKIKMEPAKLQELFTQDRKEHLEKTIIPSLKEGKFVISDRYFFSTFAYGASEGVDLNWLIKKNEDFLLPDLAIILKVSPETCISRIEKRGKPKTFFEEKSKLAKVWKIYKLFPEMFENVMIIGEEGPIEETHKKIKKIVLDKIIIE
jgi:dTMP kinase